MCIACELGLMLAFDDLPDGPPPGFPRPFMMPANDAANFACDAPLVDTPKTSEDERKP